MDIEKEEIIIGEMGVGEIFYYVDETVPFQGIDNIEGLKIIDRRIVNLPEDPKFPKYDCKVQVSRARTSKSEEIQFFLYAEHARLVYDSEVDLTDDIVSNPVIASKQGTKPLYIINGMFGHVRGAESKVERLLTEKRREKPETRIRKVLG